MSRRKAAAVDAPATRAEAIPLAAEYAQLERHRIGAIARYDAHIDKLKAERDALNAQFDTAQLALLTRLKAWWSSQGRAETKGKAKSLQLAGVTLGTKIGNPTLKLPKGMDAEAAIAFFKANGLDTLVRTKEEMNKEGAIAILRWSPPETPPETHVARSSAYLFSVHQKHLSEAGFTVTQNDKFYIEVGATEAPKVEEKEA